MNRYERLLNLYLALYATERPLTKAEIFERIPGAYKGDPESMRRGFERDKDALRKLGLPLETTVVDDESRYRLDRKQLEVPSGGFDDDELRALHVALATVRMEGADPSSALWKLGGVGEAHGEGAVKLELDPRLPDLVTATSERRVVSFRYRGEERLIEPWGVVNRSGHWYLVGRDRHKDGERNFRVDRIEDEVKLGEAAAFDKRHGRLPRMVRPWEMGEGEPITVRLLIDEALAGWAERDLGIEPVLTRNDGSIEVELDVTNVDGLRYYVLGLLDRAEVLSPPEVRNEIRTRLEEMVR